MAMVIRVRFKRAAKLYDFDPNGLELHNGMSVVTETARGVELGECMSGVMDVPDERLVLPLKPILRIATEQDLAMQKRNEQAEKEAFDIAIDRIAEHKLEMKLVDVEYAFDRSKIIFYFTANGRVDFRMLVKSLASIFKTRIELRQIGVRDEAKMLGGIGPCGRPICCRTFLSDFTPVSIKMAKEQNLSLNPTKISGLCDRLMCCLKYEQDHYEQTRKRMPRVGREIITPDGSGVINAINVLEETVRVRIAVGDSFELREYKIDDCQRPGQDERKPRPEEDATAEDAQQAAENAEGGAAETAEPNPLKKQEQRPPRGERPERAPRPERSPKPERGPRPERGERPPRPERGPRPPKKQADRPQDKEAPVKAEQPVVEEQKAVEAIDVLEIREDAKKEDLF
ncbi:MAG: stage 0 sporulation family protein [Clostridiales bacterium]|nr:stage 0 sporulation family protein [Clostridiales bacterium]